MSVSRIAARYSKALFKFHQKNMAAAEHQLAILENMLELFRTEGSGRVLTSPVMPSDLKKTLLHYALDKGKADDSLKNFMDAIVHAGRVALIPEIVESYRQLLNEAKGVVEAELVSASQLSDQEVSDISRVLNEAFGKDVRATRRVDPTLLGGFVVKVGNLLVDSSIRTRLNALAETAVQA